MRILVPSSDLRFRFYNSGGPGGQHSNRTENAVEVTHIPTGIKANGALKSQHRSRKAALKVLRSRLYAHYKALGAKERYAAGFERVRTYHEPNDRVVDHRTGKTWSYRRTVGKGDLSDVIEHSVAAQEASS